MRKIYLLVTALIFCSIRGFSQNYNVTSSPQCNNVTGGNEIVNFTGATPNANGNGTVTMYFRGDFDGKVAGGEYMDLYGEGSGPILGTTTQSTTTISNTQCNVLYDSIVVSLTMADINNWASDGTISFTADAASGVNNALCYTPAVAYCVYMRLQYPRASGLNDIGIANVVSPTIFCAGLQTISVTVQNYGINQVNSGIVNWTWNGVGQSPIFVNQLIDTAQGLSPNNIQVMLGSQTITDADTLVVWTSNPNNGADTTNMNDTLKRILAPSLNGTYTINSTVITGGTNYQTFTDFAFAINNYGICGPVVINVAAGSGPYNEQFTISQVPGNSATNTITINGNGCTLTQNLTVAGSNYATFRLDGTDYVTVNNLNIEALGATYGFGIHLGNSADNNSFNNCNITLSPTATATTSAGVVMSGSPVVYSTAGQNGSNNTFTGCNTTGGYFGFTFYGTSPAGNSNNNIVNCTAKEYYVYGSYNLQQGNSTISGNIFERPTRLATSTFYGVLLTTGCINVLVEKNIVRNAFTMQPTSTSTAYPLYCAADGTPGNENKFINNLVYNINNSGIVGGLYLTGADYIKVYHNTISLDYPASTAGATYGIYSTGTVGGIDIKNNNITITKGGSGAKYCLYYTGGFQSSNNNNLYINSVGGTNFVGYWNAGVATLAAWQTTNGGIWDGLSQSVDPLYFNPAGADFTPTNPAIDNLGVYVNVNTDILGNPRSSATPDMGAFETATAPCTTPPAAGSATANPTSGLCGGATIAVNLAGATYGAGQTYQWEESVNIGGPYVPVTGSLVSPATSLTATNTVYYRAAVTCNSITSYSTPVLVTVGAVAGTASTASSTICVGGTTTLSLAGHAANNIQWEAFDAGTSSWLPIPGATTANSSVSTITASTSVRAAVSCNSPAGTVYSNSISITVTNPQMLQTFPGSRCNTGPVTLAATGTPGSIIKWYAAPTGGNSLSTGGAFTTPSLSLTTDFYAAASSGGSTQTTAMPPTLPNVSTTTYAGLIIDVNQALVLTSVNVFSINGGSVSVELRNSAGTLLAGPTSFPLIASTYTNPQTLQLNFPIPAGTGYRLLATPGAALAYQGGSYPLPLGNNVGNIVNGAVGATSGTSTLNYYFYNLQTTTGCESPRVPVTATINGAASGTGLSTGGTTIVSSHPVNSVVNYNDACNDKVATVSNNPAALGNTGAIVLTSPTVQTFGNRPYVPRAFDITPTTNGSATVTLYALQSDFTAYNSYVTSNSLGLPLLPTTPASPNAANVRITQYHGNALTGTTGPLGLYNVQNSSFITSISTTWTGQYWAMTFPVTGFSGFFIHTGSTPLVIDLKDISAVNIGGRNRIDWSTVNEESGDRFELERSADGKNFANLTRISAKGSANSYSYWDEIPFGGINYYRLKLVHTSGSTSYSKVVSVTVKGTGAFRLEAYPNPVSDMLTVNAIGLTGADATLLITDLSGKVIKTASVTGNNTQINMAGLAQGVYLVKYSDSKQSQTIKVNKQ